MEKTVEDQLENAIESKHIEDWRLFRSLRNQAYKYLENAKKTFYVARFAKAGNIWREFGKFQGENDNKSPIKVIHEGKEVSSPKKMARIFNNFFINKVEEIQKKFESKDDDQKNLL